jgi:serine phosphatase RsbU (regulator of sigma subunit)
MNNKKLLLVILFIVYNSVFLILHAQNKKVDSILNVIKTEKEDSNKVNSLNALSYKLDQANNFDTALTCAEDAKRLAEKIEFRRGLAKAYDAVALVYADKDVYPKALENEKKALAIYEDMGSRNAIGAEYNRMATAYWKQGDFPKSLEYDLKALTEYQQTGNKRGLAACYNGISIVYEEQGNDSLALDYHKKSMAINTELGDKSGLMGDYLNTGNVYLDMGKTGDAITFYFKALELAEKLNEQRTVARCYGNLGNAYEGLGNYQQALDYGFKALIIDEKIGYKRGTSSKMLGIGSVYTKLKNYKLGRLYIDSALNVAKKIKEAEYVKNAIGTLAELDEKEGDFKNGLKDYKEYIAYRDSLINMANTKKIVQTEMNFEFQQKQAADKAEQDKKEAVAEQERKKQKVIRDAFIGGFILMLALAFFIFRGYRQKQSANRIISGQKNLVEKKQKEIVDSLYYAQKIQKALLASDALLLNNLPEYFVLYKPKDIVSGDFYWATIKDGRFYLAVCDSTGHGVPGAFMSLLNISFLNEAITEKNILQPHEVFNHTRKKLIENISQEGRQDGMDGVLITLPVKGKGLGHMIYSGAYNTPIIIRDNGVFELDADKMPVGASPKQGESFTLQTFDLLKGDAVYVFTDGYADQFGGDKGKKFKHKQLSDTLKLISKRPMAEQKKVLEETLESWKGELEQVDDILIMGIRI